MDGRDAEGRSNNKVLSFGVSNLPRLVRGFSFEKVLARFLLTTSPGRPAMPFYLTPKQDDFNQELQVCIAEALYDVDSIGGGSRGLHKRTTGDFTQPDLVESGTGVGDNWRERG